MNTIDNIFNSYEYRLITFSDKNNNFKEDDNLFKFILKVSLHEYLAPKKCIFKYGLDKKSFDKLIDVIKLNFIKSLVEPGEMVGIIAAQSIGEPTSQMTLNTKHFSGVASKGTVTMGVPRINEIISCSKTIKSPQMIVYFKDKVNKNKDEIKLITSYFKNLCIDDLTSQIEIFYDNLGSDKNSQLIKNDNVSNPFFINNEEIDISLLPIVFRIKLDIEKMMDKETTLLDIKTKFISYWYKNFTNLKSLKRNVKDIIKKITKLAILSNNKNIIHIRFLSSDISYNFILSFLKIVLNEMTLKGLNNISNVDIDHERLIELENNDLGLTKEYVATTSGINFSDLLKLRDIDTKRTRCNDIYTTYLRYGIEAARNILINELIFTFNATGSEINHSHLSILVDLMTFTGNLISIDRHGLQKINLDTISKASFEKTLEHFTNAALFNSRDNVVSVSSRVCVGRVINGGTGYFDLQLDANKIINSEISDEEGIDRYFKMKKNNLFSNILESTDSFNDIFIPNN